MLLGKTTIQYYKSNCSQYTVATTSPAECIKKEDNDQMIIKGFPSPIFPYLGSPRVQLFTSAKKRKHSRFKGRNRTRDFSRQPIASRLAGQIPGVVRPLKSQVLAMPQASGSKWAVGTRSNHLEIAMHSRITTTAAFTLVGVHYNDNLHQPNHTLHACVYVQYTREEPNT